MKHFLKQQLNVIVLWLMLTLLFGLIFYLFDLPFIIFRLGGSLYVFVLLIYLVLEYVKDKKELETKERLATLQEEYNQYQAGQLMQEKAMEEYFLLWIHQIKTPITASKLLCERLDNQMGDLLQQELLKIENYTQMVLSYLNLHKQDADLTIQSVTIHELVSPLLKKYRVNFLSDHTRLHYERNDQVVVTDIKWTRLMIEQLLNNALKYAKGREIWISYDESKQVLSIRDSGIGIKASDLPKIFDRGYSGLTGGNNENSTGIGLFLVEAISKRLNQPVSVQSEVGKGSQFDISFNERKLTTL